MGQRRIEPQKGPLKHQQLVALRDYWAKHGTGRVHANADELTALANELLELRRTLEQIGYNFNTAWRYARAAQIRAGRYVRK